MDHYTSHSFVWAFFRRWNMTYVVNWRLKFSPSPELFHILRFFNFFFLGKINKKFSYSTVFLATPLNFNRSSTVSFQVTKPYFILGSKLSFLSSFLVFGRVNFLILLLKSFGVSVSCLVMAHRESMHHRL